MANNYVEITLDWFECEQAAIVGVRRRIESLRQGCRSKFVDGTEWDIDINGTASEMAFAKAAGMYYSYSNCTTGPESYDVGRIQVRASAIHSNNLLVRERDKDESVFVLVTGVIPTFRIHGWAYGRDAKQPQWKRALKHKCNTPVWLMPQGELRPIQTLKQEACTP